MPKLTPQLSTWAETDLTRIAEYTLETWGEHQLLRYRAVLEQGFATITRDPDAPRSKTRDELFPGCRSFHVGRHVILYRVKEGTLEIARILHDSMELERHIPTEFSAALEHGNSPASVKEMKNTAQEMRTRRIARKYGKP